MLAGDRADESDWRGRVRDATGRARKYRSPAIAAGFQLAPVDQWVGLASGDFDPYQITIAHEGGGSCVHRLGSSAAAQSGCADPGPAADQDYCIHTGPGGSGLACRGRGRNGEQPARIRHGSRLQLPGGRPPRPGSR